MNLIQYICSTEFLYMWIRVATPILLAALGAAVCNKAGVVNLGLEGIMLISALFGVLGGAMGGNLFWGFLTGVGSALVVSAIFAYFHLILKANATLCGTAINTAATGLTVFVLQLATGEKGNSSSLRSFSFPEVEIPLIKDIPVVGDILSGHNALTYTAILMVVLVYILLYKTPLGLRMRAVGENPNAASSVGQDVVKIRFIAIIICGVLTGLGGMYLSMGYINRFTTGMVAGRGYISLATQAMAGGNSLIGIVSSFLYAFGNSIAIQLQNLGLDPYLITIIPYFFIIVFYVVFSLLQLRREQMKLAV